MGKIGVKKALLLVVILLVGSIFFGAISSSANDPQNSTTFVLQNATNSTTQKNSTNSQIASQIISQSSGIYRSIDYTLDPRLIVSNSPIFSHDSIDGENITWETQVTIKNPTNESLPLYLTLSELIATLSEVNESNSNATFAIFSQSIDQNLYLQSEIQNVTFWQENAAKLVALTLAANTSAKYLVELTTPHPTITQVETSYEDNESAYWSDIVSISTHLPASVLLSSFIVPIQMPPQFEAEPVDVSVLNQNSPANKSISNSTNDSTSSNLTNDATSLSASYDRAALELTAKNVVDKTIITLIVNYSKNSTKFNLLNPGNDSGADANLTLQELSNLSNSTNNDLNQSSQSFFTSNISDITLNSTQPFVLDLSSYINQNRRSSYSILYTFLDNISIRVNESQIVLIADANYSGSQTLQFFADDGQGIYDSNPINVTVISSNDENQSRINASAQEQDTYSPVVAGKPVLWKKRIARSSLNQTNNFYLPENASNVTVVLVDNIGLRTDLSASAQLKKALPQGSFFGTRARQFVDKLVAASPFNITFRQHAQNLTPQPLPLFGLVDTNNVEQIQQSDLPKYALDAGNTTVVEINQSALDVAQANQAQITTGDSTSTNSASAASDTVEIGYQLPGPTQEITSKSPTIREIVVSSDVHYQNVTVQTQLPIPAVDPRRVILVWHQNISNVSVDSILPYNLTDTDNDSVYDTITWTAPHLSTQTFDIIVITTAEELDENRLPLRDVYSQVSTRDGISATIPAGHYVRVQFERPLDSTRDITIYAKPTVDQTIGQITVYEYNDTVPLATFENISPSTSPDGKYKILLTNLGNRTQDIFDLYIDGPDVDIDQIVDPLLIVTNPGMLIYAAGTTTTPLQYRLWNGSGFGTNLSMLNATNTVEWSHVAASPTRYEYVAGTADTNDQILYQVYFYNTTGGFCWGNGTTCGTVHAGSTTSVATNYNKLAIQYEHASGRAMAVYSVNNKTPEYTIWNGSFWTAPLPVNQTFLGGTIQQVTLIQHPSSVSNELALLMTDSNFNATIIVWNGTAWYCQASTSAALFNTAAYQSADIAYEQKSGDLFAAYGINGVANFDYIQKANNTCTFTQTRSPAQTERSDKVNLASQAGSDFIGINFERISQSDMIENIWSGTALLGQGPDETTVLTPVSPDLYFAPAFLGTSNVSIFAYGDAAASTNLRYMWYNVTSNVWTCGATGCAAAGITNFSGQSRSLQQYSIPNQNASLIFVRDTNNNLTVRQASVNAAGSPVFADVNGGLTLQQNIPSAAFPYTFNFAWQQFNDTSTPQVGYLAGTTANGVNLSQNWIFLNLSVNSTDQANITFSLYNITSFSGDAAAYAGEAYATLQEVVINNTQYSVTDNYNFTGLADGLYLFNATVTNLNGNSNYTVSRIVRLDTNTPSLTFVTPPTPTNNIYQQANYTLINISLAEFQPVNVTFSWNTSVAQLYNSSLILQYDFDNVASLNESLTNILDSSLLGANNATSIGTTRWNTSEKYGANAISFDGSTGYTTGNTQYNNMQTFTLELWFRTNTAQGGKLIGWGNLRTGASSSYDRHIYMLNNGTLAFGIYNGGTQVVYSKTNLNDNNWHQVVATLTAAGGTMSIYVDGILQNTQAAVTAENTLGYWRTGYDNLNGWPNLPTSNFFNGAIDAVRVYTVALSANEVSQHYASSLFHTGPSTWTLISNQTNLSLGTYNYFACANDTVQKSACSSVQNLTVHYIPPTISYVTLTEASSTIVNRRYIQINVSANDTYLSWINTTIYNSTGFAVNSSNFSVALGTTTSNNFTNMTVYADGVYYFNATASDLAGNINSTSTRNITIDTVGPQIGFYSATTDPNSTYVNRNFILVNVSINETNLQNVTIRLYNSTLQLNNSVVNTTSGITWFAANFSNLTDGMYWFNATANDIANNTNKTFTYNVTVDTRNPNISYITFTDVAGANVSRNWIAANVTSNDTNFRFMNLSLYNSSLNLIWTANSTTSANVTLNKSGLADGLYYFNATATDWAGNQNFTATRNVTIDTVGPQIGFAFPTDTNATYLNRNWIFANVSVNETNLINTTIWIYNGSGTFPLVSTSVNFTNGITFHQVNFTNLPNGPYRVNATIIDVASNLNKTGTYNFTIDTIRPNISYITFTEVVNANITHNWIIVNITANDTNFRFMNTTVYNSSLNLIWTANGTTSANLTLNLSGLADGTYYFNSTATDWAGWTNSTATRTVTIDTKSPQIAYVAPTDIDGLYTNRSWIFVNVSIVESNLSNVTIRLYNFSGNLINQSANFTNGITFHQVNFSNLADGVYYFNVTAWDTFGNSNSTLTRVISIDTAPPDIYFSLPTMVNGTIITNTTVITKTSYALNISIENSSDIYDLEYNWNATNYSMYNSSLMAMYNFDNNSAIGENAATVKDIGPWRGYNLTVNGAPPWIPVAKFNGAYNFTGSNYLRGNYNSNRMLLNSASTVNLWLNMVGMSATGTNADGIMHKGDLGSFTDEEFSLQMTGVGTIGYYVMGTAFGSTAYAANYGTWHMITAVFNASQKDFYIDGVLKSSTQNANVLTDLGGDLIVGCQLPVPQYCMNGSIDQLSIWNGTLSPAQIQELYMSTVQKVTNTSWYLYVNQTNSSVSGLWDGNYTYSAFINDTAGNSNSTETRLIIVDTVPPQIGYLPITDANNTYVNRNYIMVNVTVNDTNFANVTVYLYNSTLQLNSSFTNATTGFKPLNYFVNFTNLVDGMYWFNATAIDLVNLTNISKTYNVTVDTIRPNISFIINTEVNNTNLSHRWFLVNVTANDTNFKNMNITIYNSSKNLIWTQNGTISTNLTINFTAPYDGVFYFNGTATDWAGNQNFTETRQILIDTTGPQIGIFTAGTDANNTYVNRNYVLVNISVNETNLQNATIWLYNSTFNIINSSTNTTIGMTNFSANFTGLADGMYWFNATVYDAANNTNRTLTYNVTIDTIKPNISFIINTEVNNTNLSHRWFLVNITSNDTNFKNMNITIYNSSKNLIWTQNGTISTNLTINFTAPYDGVFYFNGTATDWAGNQNFTETRQILIDTTGPQIGFFTAGTDSNNTYLNRNYILVNVSVNETNLQNATIWLYNGTFNIINSSTNTTIGMTNFSVNFTGLADGMYWFNATVYDAANNTNRTLTYNVTIDTTNPNISFVTRSEAGPYTFVQRNYIETNTSVGDANFANISVYLYNNSGATLVNISNFTISPIFFNITGLPEGIYVFNATTFDKARNFNFTDTRFVGIDLNNPTISYVTPTQANATFINVNTTTINITTADTFNTSTYLDWNRSLLLYYSFSNWSGTTVIDDSSYRRNGTLNNSVAVSSLYPIRGANANFSGGNNDLINTSSTFMSGLSELTISFFARSGATGSDRGLFRAQPTTGGVETFGARYDATGANSGKANTLTYAITTTAGTWSAESQANIQQSIDWQHIALTWKSGEGVKLYINGSLVNASWNSSSTIGGSISLPDNTLLIGDGSQDQNWLGQLDEFMVFGRALNATEVRALADSKNSVSLQATLTNVSDGNYSYSAIAQDISGRWSTPPNNNRWLVIDTVAPNISYITATEVAGANLSRTWFIANVSANDTYLANISVRLYNSTGGLINTTNASANGAVTLFNAVNYTNLADGLYFYNATATDLATNTNNTLTRNVTIDTVPPSVAYVAPTLATGSFTNNNFTTVNVTAVDANLFNVTIWLYNSTGNLINSSTGNGVGASPFLANFTNLPDGLYFYNATAYDTAANLGVAATRNITIDTVKPIINYVAPTETNNTYINRRFIVINVTGSDAVAFANLSIRLYNSTLNLINSSNTTNNAPPASPDFANFTVYADGIYWFNATATDNASNINSTLTYKVTVDTVSPQIGFVAPTNVTGVNSSRSFISINASYNETNLQNVTIWLYNSSGNLINSSMNNTFGSSNYFFNFTGLADGLYFYNATIIDLVNLTNFTETRNFTVDTTPPQIGFINATEISNTIIQRTWFIVNVTVNDTNLRYINITVYNSTGGLIYTLNGTNPVNLTLNLSVASDGMYYFNATATDWAGNVNSTVTRNVTVATVYPQINYTAPTETNATYVTHNWLFVNVSINSSFLQNVTIWLYNSSLKLINTSVNFTNGITFQQINFSNLPDGQYWFNATIITSGFLTNLTPTYNVTIDTIQPNISYIAQTDADASGVSRRYILVNVTANDTNFRYMNISVYNSSGSLLWVQNGTTAANLTLNLSVPSDGIYFFNATATDWANWTNSTPTRTVTVDTINPLIAFVAPTVTNNTYLNISNLTINTTVTELNLYSFNFTWNQTQLSLYDQTLLLQLGFNNMSGLGENGNASIRDSSIYNRTAVMSNSYIQPTGKYGTAAYFTNLSSSYVNVSLVQTAVTNYSIEAWFRTNGTQGMILQDRGLSGAGQSLTLAVGPSCGTPPTLCTGATNGKLGFGYDTNGIWVGTYGNNTVNDGQWHHVIGVFSSKSGQTVGAANFTLYVDGVLQAGTTQTTGSPAASPLTGLGNTLIGYHESWNAPFSGYIDELRVWNRSLVQNEVSLLYQSSFTKYNQTGYVFTANLTNQNEGTYNYQNCAGDIAGNTNCTATQNVTIDTIKPSIAYISATEVPGANISRNWFIVNVTANDSNFRYMNITVYNSSNNLIFTLNGTSPTNLTLNITGLVDGVYFYNASATDWANWTNYTSTTRNVTIDTVPPQIGYVAPTETNATYITHNWIYVNVSLNETNLQNVTIWLYNSSLNLINTSVNFTNGITFQQINFSNLPDGRYCFNATAIDWAGNANKTFTYNVTIDTTRPNISYIAATEVPWANISRAWFIVNVTANDTNFRFFNISVFNSTGSLLWLQNGTNATNLTLNFTTPYDGTFFYNATVQDWANWTNSTATQNVTVDTLAPQIGFTFPTAINNTYTNKTWIFVNVSVNETNLLNVTIRLYNSTGNLINQSANFTSGILFHQFNFSGLADGVYFYNATAWDVVGNQNSTVTNKITIDTINPTATYAGPSDIATAWYNRNYILVNVSAVDTNFANTTISLLNISQLQINSSFNTSANAFVNFTGLADGAYYFNATVMDFAKNYLLMPLRKIFIDTVNPNLQFVTPTPANNYYSQLNWIYINATTSDATSNSTSTHLDWNRSLVLYMPFDDYNNNAFVADNSSWGNNGTLYNASRTVLGQRGSGMAFRGSQNSSVVVNTSTSGIDLTTGGTIEAFAYYNGSAESVNPTVVCKDNITSGYCLTLTAVILPYHYRITVNGVQFNSAANINGNQLNHVAVTFNATNVSFYINGVLDKTFASTPPVAVAQNLVIGDSPRLAQAWNGTIDEVKIFNRALSAQEIAAEYNSSAAANQLFVNLTNLADGTYNYYAQASDQAFNLNRTVTQNVTVDTIPPNISYIATTDVAGANLSHRWILVNITANDTNFRYMNITIYNSSNNLIFTLNGTNATNLTLNFTAPSDGIFYFNATATDLAGWTNQTATRNVTIDTLAPNITYVPITETTGTYITHNWMAVNVTANDTHLASINVSFYNSAFVLIWTQNLTTSNQIDNLSFNLTGLADGEYWFNAIATDSFGNTNSTAASNVTIDTTRPNISYIASTEVVAANLTRNWFIVNVTANDSNFRFMNISVYNSSGNLIYTQNGTTSANLTLNFTAPKDGVYYYNATATDWANWTNSTLTRNVTIDSTPPQIGFTFPTLNNTYTNNTWVFVNVSVNETNLFNVTILLYNSSGNLINQSANFTSGILFHQVNFTGLTDGVYFYNATAWDTALNQNSTLTYKITIDTINPTASYVAPSDIDTAWYNRNYILVNVSATDINFANTTISLLNISQLQINSSLNTSANAFINFTGLADGAYYYNATVMDFARNYLLMPLRQIFIDTVSPSLQFVNPTPATNTYTQFNWVYVNTTTSDATSNSTSTHLDWNRSLVLYMPFDDYYNNAFVADNSSWGNNGTIYNASRTVLGQRGSGMTFRGSQNSSIVVNTSQNLDLTTGGTLEAFIYYNGSSQSTSPTIICKLGLAGGGYCLALSTAAGNHLKLSIGLGSLTSTTTILANQWYHVAATFDGTNWSLYLNGTLDNTSVNAALPTSVTTDLTVGNSQISPSAWNGTIDEVKIFKRALSAQEIAAEYNSSAAAKQLFVNITNLADGVYNYYAQAVDQAANYNVTATRNITVDTIKPSIAFIASTEVPGANLSRNWFIANVTANDTNFRFINITVYNSSNNLIFTLNGTSPTNLTLNFTVPRDGIYYFNATATDWAGWTNSTATQNVTIDSTPPQIGFAFPTAANNTYTNNTWIFVNVSVNETNLLNVTIRLYNSSGNLINQSANFTSGILFHQFNFSGLTDGVYFYNATAWDVVSNQNSTQTNTITIDTINPTASYTSPSDTDTAWYNRNYILVNVSATDINFANTTISLLNISQLQINSSLNTSANGFINFTGLADGAYYYNATVMDFARNYLLMPLRKIFIDTIVPALQFVNPTPATNIYSQVNWVYVNTTTSDATSNSTSTHLDWNRSLVLYYPFDDYNNNAFVADNSSWGNNGTIYNASRTVLGQRGSAMSFIGKSNSGVVINTSQKLDLTTGGTIEAFIYYNGTSQSAFPSIVCKGTTVTSGYCLNLANAGGLVLSLSVGPNTLQSTNHIASNQWYHVAVTFDGQNWSIYLNGTLDKTVVRAALPLVLITNVVIGDSPVGPFAFNGSIDEVKIFSRALSAQEIAAEYNSSAAANQLFVNMTNLAEGTYNYYAQAVDQAANYNRTSTRNITVDTIKPSIAFIASTEVPGANLSRTWFIANVTANDTNFRFMNITVYNSTGSLIYTLNGTNSTNLTLNFTAPQDGVYFFNASATDWAGWTNYTSATQNVTIDTISPQIGFFSATTDANNSYLNRRYILINVSINETNLQNVTINLYNSTVNLINSSTNTTSGITSWFANFTVASDGIYSFNASVYDVVGNFNRTYTYNVTVDATPPTISYVPITEPDQSYLNQTFIRVNVSSSDFTFANVTIFLYNSTFGLINSSTNSTNGNYFLNFTNLPEGIYYFNATVFDLALNQNSTATRKVVVDPNFPQIAFISPTPPDNTTSTNTTYTFNVSTNETFLQDFNFEMNGVNTTILNGSTVLFLGFNNVSSIGDNATTTIDQSGYLNNATCIGNCNYTAGKYGLGLAANGTNTTAKILDAPSLDNSAQMSWEMWFNAKTLDGNPRAIMSKRQIVDVEDSYSFFMYTGNKFDADIVNTNDRLASNTTFVTNTWYHVIVTYDGTAAAATRTKIYVNGVLDAVGTETSTSIPNYNSNITIGALNENYGTYFNGTIDEVRIYNLTLSATDVAMLYASNLHRYNQTNWLFESTINNMSGTNTYRACAVDYTRDGNCTSLRNLTVNSTNQYQLQLTNITFSNSTAIEGQNTTVNINVSNLGPINATNVTVQFNISLWNGTTNLLFTTNFTGLNISNGSSIMLQYNWTVPVGIFQFDAMVDPANLFAETNESDNSFSINYSTSSWNIYYGNFGYGLQLEDNKNDTLRNWSTSGFGYNLYYSDTDAVYSPANLRAFNQTDDFNESDVALNISGYNDSIRRLFDKNGDGIADQTTTFVVGGVTVNNVPYINSTNTSSFITGILWDSADGANYNGSQDLVFVTRVNVSKVGYYGTYDYEVRVPSGTRKLKPSTDTVTQLVELT